MSPPPDLPNEIIYEGYQYGKSRGAFVDVQNHPEYVILGRSAYVTATTLAITEAALETAVTLGTAYLRYVETLRVEAATGGANPAGIALGSTWIGIITAAQIAADVAFNVGRYRYEWLKAFRENGTPRNFVSQYSSVGWYNHLVYENDFGNKLRGLAAARYLKGGGRYAITEKKRDPTYQYK